MNFYMPRPSSYCGAIYWSILPNHIKDINNFNAFKCALKVHVLAM